MMKKKILIVDDEPDILDILSYNLEKEGYDLMLANNGEKAISKANEFKPDLILLDIMMPKKDGIEVCRELRQKSKFSNTYIVFLTARGEEFSEVAGFEAGGDDYVVKPIRPRSLMSRIKNILKKERIIDDKKEVLVFADLTIDTNKHKVYIGDKKIDLTKKEFKILLFLSSKPERVFTREEIYNRVWESNTIVGERTLDVHIRKIRKKLQKEYIKTIKGVGYSFVY